MKKIFSMFAIMLAFFCATISAEAAKINVNLMPIENVAAEEMGVTATAFMRSHISNTFKNSANYSIFLNEAGQATSAETQYSILGILNSAEVTKSKDKKRMLELLPIALGNEAEDGKAVSEEERNAAKKELKDMSDNPFRATVAFEVNVKANTSDEIVLAKTFTETQSGKTESDAVSNACKVISVNILKELNNSINGISNTEETSAVESDVTEKEPLKETTDFSAKVADMYESEIYIDKGTASGLKVGDTVVIVRNARNIIVGGKIVDRKFEEVGKAVVKKVEDGYSVCEILTIKEGTEVKNGDDVRLS